MNDSTARIFRIFERFQNYFEAISQFKLQLSFSRVGFENSNDVWKWNQFLQEISYVPVGWNETSIRYQKAYLCSNGAKTEVFKFIVSNSKNLMAIFTVSIEINKLDLVISYKLRNISPPLMKETSTIEDRKLIYYSWLSALEKLSHEIEIDGVLLEISIDKEIFLEVVRVINLEKLFEYVGKKEYYCINLVDSEKNIYENVRKSYKSLINQQIKKYEYKILCSDNYEQKSWEDFRLLHLRVSGRITRSEETWNLQGKMIKEGNAFLVSAFHEDKIIGGTFIILSKNDAYYGVGAYIRGVKELICSHSLQYLAINEAKRIGITKYILGDACLENDYFKYSEKEKNIAHFKKGFTISTITTEAFLLH